MKALLVIAAILIMPGLYPAARQDVDKEVRVELLVAAGAGLTAALSELGPLYERHNPAVRVVTTFGSSGSLAEQIKRGAPIDAFISASVTHMDTLTRIGMVDGDATRVIASSELVLIVPEKSSSPVSFKDLAKASVARVAIGEPSSVPAGAYAEQTLRALGLLDQIRGKLVFAKDVRQAAVWAAAGEADAAIVYPSAIAGLRVRIVERAPEQSHQPIAFPGSVVSASKNRAEALAFLNWLSSPEASAIFARHGLRTP